MAKDVIKPSRSDFFRYLKAYLPFWQKKRIGFYANFGHGDLGDDASFFVARKLLGWDILPISKRCHAFNPHMLKGFLIGSGATLRWESPYIPRRILTRNKWKFPVVLFSAGLNCDYHKEFSRETKETIKNLCGICDYLTVKDKTSQRFINNLGFDNVNILPDLGLALEEKGIQFNFAKKRFSVGVVLTPHSEFSPDIFKKMVNVFSQFTDYLTYRDTDVVYIPFEKGCSENTKESQLIQEVIKNARHKERIRILEEDLDPGEMLSFIKAYCDAMICTRLHSAVFSVNAGVPFLCISYNIMHDAFLEMLDACIPNISIFDEFYLESLKERFEYLLKNYDTVKSGLIEKREYLRTLIHKEISYIKKMMESKVV